MRITEKQYQYRSEYNKATYDQIQVRISRKARIRERIAIAAKQHGETSAKYMQRIIETALQADGVTLDSLPADDDDDMKK